MKQLLTLTLSLVSALSFAQTAPTSYTIERSTSPAFTSPVAVTSTTTSYTATGLTSGTTYYFRIRGSNGTVASTGSYSSLSVATGVASTATSMTFTNAEVGFPITYFAGPPPYYQGTASTDWGSGGNTGLATTKIPSGSSGYVRFQYTGPTQVAIGFDSLNAVQSAGYPAIRAGVFLYNSQIGVVRNGTLVNVGQVPAVNSYLQVRREITGGVATYYVEYSADGTSWTNITPAPTAPATKYFTFSTTGDIFTRVAINDNYIIVDPKSSSSTPR